MRVNLYTHTGRSAHHTRDRIPAMTRTSWCMLTLARSCQRSSADCCAKSTSDLSSPGVHHVEAVCVFSGVRCVGCCQRQKVLEILGCAKGSVRLGAKCQRRGRSLEAHGGLEPMLWEAGCMPPAGGDDDVIYLFLQKQKIGAELHIYL